MGQLVFIESTGKKASDKLNKILEESTICNMFHTEAHNIDWLKEINTDPKSQSAYLKPEGKDLTMEELKKRMGMWATENQMSFDVGFSRTSDEQAAAYAEFIVANKDSIKQLRGADELIERYDLTEEQIEVIKAMNYVEPEPEKLPVEEQTKKTLQGGLLLCKSFSPKPFWVMFGNVKSPSFMKDRIYKDDDNNSLYRDKQGYGYLLLPLMPMSSAKSTSEFCAEVYGSAHDMGLREDPYYFVPIIYGLDIDDKLFAGKQFAKSYTQNEIVERFSFMLKHCSSISQRGFGWDVEKQNFRSYGNGSLEKIQAQMSILTCLLIAASINIGASSAIQMWNTVNPTITNKIKLTEFKFELN
jgi:hypothetical protein